jgi:hypothetical protein
MRIDQSAWWRRCRRAAALAAAFSMFVGVAISQDLPPLRIEILAGNRAVNSVTSPNVIAPRVRVRDNSGKTVPATRVRFQLPDTALGHFAGGAAAIDRETNADGEAAAWGYVATRPGAFTLKVIADHQGQTATAEIRQRNGSQQHAQYEAPKGSRKWIWIVVGAAVGGTLAAVLRPKSSPTATITLGAPTVSGR